MTTTAEHPRTPRLTPRRPAAGRPTLFLSAALLLAVAGVLPAGGLKAQSALNGIVISSAPAANTFEGGDTISVTTAFSASVTVTGSPQLALIIGTDTVQAAFASGSGSASLVFRYVVQSTDLDSDGISIGANALTLNSGTINDGGGTPATLTIGLLAITNSSAHTVNGAAVTVPAVSAMSIISTPLTIRTYGQVETIEVRVTFVRPVVVTGTPQLAIRVGNTDRQANFLDISAGRRLTFRYMVQSTDLDNSGISVAANALTLNSGSINDARDGTTAATLTIPAASVVTDDSDHRVDGNLQVGPSVERVSMASTPSSEGVYGLGERIEVRVDFNLPVWVTGTPQLALQIGTETRQANYVSGRGTMALLFRYVVVAEDADQDGLALASPSALTLNGGTLHLAGGNNDQGENPESRAPAALGLGSVRSALPGHAVDGTKVEETDEDDEEGELAFGSAEYEFELVENTPGPVAMGQVGVVSPHGGAVLYSLGDGTEGLFEVDASSGAVTYVGQGEDAEHRSLYLMQATATLGEDSVAATVKVKVVNVNEPPAFSDERYVFGLEENAVGPLLVGAIEGIDLDEGDTLTYRMVPQGGGSDAAELFDVDAATGDVRYLGGGEDYEAEPGPWQFDVSATDLAGLTATTTVVVKMTDVNEAPVFADSAYDFAMEENAAGPLALGSVMATDPDRGDRLTYTLAEGDPTRFEVDAASGEVRYIGGGEDLETNPDGFELVVATTDQGDLGATSRVTVSLVDLNEPPAFQEASYGFEIAENTPGPLTLGTVEAVDSDLADTVSYALAGQAAARFAVDAASGEIQYVGEGEDYEGGPDAYEFEVVARDRQGLAGRAAVAVTVLDVNEAPVFADSIYAFDLEENSAGPLALGQVEATDADEGDVVSYSLASGDETRFEVDASTGALRYMGAGEDYEAGPSSFAVTVRATDAGGLTTEADVTVTLLNANEAPVFADSIYAFDLEENSAGPLALGQVEATDADEGDAVSYSLASGDEMRFEVDGSTGELRYVGAGEDYETGPSSFAVTVRATDAGGLTTEADVTVMLLDVNEGPEAVGSISRKMLEAFGTSVEENLEQYFRDPEGDALTYTAESSAPGVAAATIAAGRLSIQPRATGAATVTVTATDPGGLSASQRVQVDVEASRSERARAVQLAMAAFGRSVGAETIDAVGSRLGMESSGAKGQPHVQLGGRTVECLPGADGGGCGLAALARNASGLLGLRLSVPTNQQDAWAQSGRGGHSLVTFDPLSLERLGSESSFQLAFGGARGGLQEAGGGTRKGWTLWGRAGAGGFDGRPKDDFTLEGTTRSAYLGLDYRFGTGLLVGLAGSRSTTALDFESEINGAGSVDARLTSLYPYVHWSPRRGLGVWGLAGAGRGSADLEERVGGRFATDLTMRMAALGARQALYRGFALKADAFAVRIQSDAVTDLAGVTAHARRLRLAPELSATWSAGEGVSLRARVEAGARFDGGDAETGAGAEAGAAFGFAHHATGLVVDVQGRTLLAHQADDYRDWGAGFAVQFRPGGEQGGLSLSLAPSWGNAASGAATLWRDGAAGFADPAYRQSPSGALAAGDPDQGWTPGRLDMQVGWDVLLPGGGQVTPFGRWSREGADGHRVNVGTRWTVLGARPVGGAGGPVAGGLLGPGGLFGVGGPTAAGARGLHLELDLFGEHIASGVQPPAHRLTLQGKIGFK